MKNIRFVIVVAIFAFCGPAHAEDEVFTKKFSLCEEKAGGTTFETLDCINAEFKRQDERLNQVYQKLLLVLVKAKQDELRKVQRTWLQYSEQDCGFLYDASDFNGQDDRLNAAYCRARERSNRASKLEGILKRF